MDTNKPKDAAEALDVRTDSPQPYGYRVSSEIAGDGYPMFRILGLRGPRDDEIWRALRDMRRDFLPCVLFIREDGLHESWGRTELERLANTHSPSEENHLIQCRHCGGTGYAR